MFRILLLVFIFTSFTIDSSALITKSIRFFGAKGDGRTNDHDAFKKAAAYFNKIGGNGKLIIPRGTYIVGRQIRSKTSSRYLIEDDIFYLKNCNNFSIEGTSQSRIFYVNNLRFGTFNPIDGKKFNPPTLPFYDMSKTAQIGCLFRFENCNNIKITDLDANGNNRYTIIGGSYGDMGIQLWHYGLHIVNCYEMKLTRLKFHHFCLDGIMINNQSDKNSNISILNSAFNYNGRQGGLSSPPASGVDIEPTDGATVSQGTFENCTFINNKGCGLVADNTNSSNMTFKNCTYWGVDLWSLWIRPPAYSFYNCKIYGSFVNGCYTSIYNDATKFFTCTFKDSSYFGREVYGNYLIECDTKKKMVFDHCAFVAKKKNVMWYNGVGSTNKEDLPEFINCTVEKNGVVTILHKP
jgi:hypothetical protein